MKIVKRVSELLSGQDLHTKINEGAYFRKKGDIIVFILFTTSDDALYLYQVCGNYLKGFQRLRFLYRTMPEAGMTK